MRKENVIKYISEKMYIHKQEYLDQNGVRQYRALAAAIADKTGEDIGIKKALKDSFMKQYGITEIEAINILNGFHMADYLLKYEHLKQCDEMRKLLFAELQHMWIPDEVTSKQVDDLSDIFIVNRIDKRLIKLYDASDRIMQAQLLLRDLLKR